MELKVFVKETLVSIVEGVQLAQSTEMGGHINPKWDYTVRDSGHVYKTADERLARLVSFDVAVTVTESKSAETGGKISVIAAKFGAEGELSKAEETASKISFQIPITLPNA